MTKTTIPDPIGLNASPGPYLVIVKCKNEAQVMVELELCTVFGWRTSDLMASRVHPETHTLLIMNTYQPIWNPEWDTHMQKMKAKGQVTSIDYFKDTQEEEEEKG